jgi:hypothetical protein
MIETAFVITLAAILVPGLVWAFRALPREEWQILASYPTKKTAAGLWEGMNLTYYGLLAAGACVVATTLFVILMGSIGAPRIGIIAVAVAVLLTCAAASRPIARLVEGKPNGFTVGGAFFLGLLAGPFLLGAVNEWIGKPAEFRIPTLPALAALSIAYVLGEGLGRTACISFGCCYGKPLDRVGPWARRVFEKLHFSFEGPTKKIAYDSGWERVKVVPIQAITAAIYTATAVAGVALFLHSHFRTAFLLCIVLSQLWRAYSETLRADYRGGGRISAYQVMALLSVGIAIAACCLLPEDAPARPNVRLGLMAIWDPGVILALQAVGGALFLYMGRSAVTGSSLTFHVHHDRI